MSEKVARLLKEDKEKELRKLYKNELKQASGKEKLKIINDFGTACRKRKKNNLALEIYRQGVAESHELGEDSMECFFLKECGLINKELEQVDDAILDLDSSLKLSLKLKDFSTQAAIMRSLGSLYSMKQDHLKSLKYLQNSLKLQQKIGDKKEQAFLYFEIGLEHADADDQWEGLENLQRAYQIFKALGCEKEVKMVITEIKELEFDSKEKEWIEERTKKFKDLPFYDV